MNYGMNILWKGKRVMANKYEAKKLQDRKLREEEILLGELLADPVEFAKFLDQVLQKTLEYIIEYKQSKEYLMKDFNMFN